MAYILKDYLWGTFLGCTLEGTTCWSNVNPLGQDMAITFKDLDDARQFLSSLHGFQRRWITAYEVIPDLENYISVAALVQQGHEGWIHEGTPTANLLPA